jgi:single-stranded-DNA-specific exonuclease
LDPLVERLTAAAAKRQITVAEPIVADYALPESGLDWALFKALVPLRPFGAANSEPVFMTAGLQLVEARAVGAAGKHLRTRIRFGRQTLTGFGPDLGDRAPALAAARRMDALYTIGVSTWDGRDSLELRLQAVREAT